MVRTAVALAAVLAAGGCAMTGSEARSAAKELLLFDAHSGTTSRPHCHTVDDPLGGPGKVVVGELVENDNNKTTFLNDAGFFTVPEGWRGAVVVRAAVKGARKFRIALVADSGALKSYHQELPAENRWSELVLPLKELSAKIRPGERIVDISIWQLGGGKEGALYIERAVFRAE